MLTMCFLRSERYHLAFKIVRTESRLVRGILTNHGFSEVMCPANRRGPNLVKPDCFIFQAKSALESFGMRCSTTLFITFD